MSRVCSFSLCLAAWLASFATVHGDEAKSPRTDLYGDPLPPGAVARFGTVRLRHASSLFTFSADGKQLISFGAEGEIRVWEVATGKLHRSKWLWWEQPDLRETTRDGHSLRSRIDLTPDGTTAAALREDAIYIYDTATGELRRRISIEARDSNEWLELSLTFDGKLLTVVRWAEGKAAVTIQLWNVSTGKLRQSIKITIPEMRPIAHSSDGKYLLGMLKDSDIHVWDTSTGKKVDRFERNVYGIPLFSPNNKLLAAVVDRLQVRLWDATTHREKALIKVSSDVGNDCSFRSIAFSPDARFLAGDYDNSSSMGNKPKEGIIIWDVSKGREVRRFPESGVSSLALAPDGKTLACAGWDSEIRLWDVASGRQLHLRPGHSSLVRSLAVSPDGRVLASGAIGVRLWDTATGKQLRVFEQGDPEVLVSTDGTRVASTTRLSYNQDSIRVWEVATGKEVREVLITRPRFASDFSRLEAFGLSADGKRVTAVMFNNPPRATSVYHWRIDTGELLSKRSYAKDKHDPNVRASISPDGERLCLCRQGKIIIEDAETGRRPRTLHQAIAVLFSHQTAGSWRQGTGCRERGQSRVSIGTEYR